MKSIGFMFNLAGGIMSQFWDREPHDSIGLFFNLHNPDRKEAFKFLEARLSANQVFWLKPADRMLNEWILDLGLLKETYEFLRPLTWLKGRIRIKPEFEIKVEETFGKKTNKSHIKIILTEEDLRTMWLETDIVHLKPFLEKFSFDHPAPMKCAFLMMRFEKSEICETITDKIKDICRSYNIEAIRADDKRYSEDLFTNIQTYMHGCGFGIAVFETEFNPNVSLEVGYMIALRKNVCLMKDETLQLLPSDLIGRLYEPFNTLQLEQIQVLLEKWFIEKEIVHK